MPVKLQFRNQIRARDTEKGAGAKRQSAAETCAMGVRPTAGTEVEQQYAQRGHQGEPQVDQVPG